MFCSRLLFAAACAAVFLTGTVRAEEGERDGTFIACYSESGLRRALVAYNYGASWAEAVNYANGNEVLRGDCSYGHIAYVHLPVALSGRQKTAWVRGSTADVVEVEVRAFIRGTWKAPTIGPWNIEVPRWEESKDRPHKFIIIEREGVAL